MNEVIRACHSRAEAEKEKSMALSVREAFTRLCWVGPSGLPQLATGNEQ